MAGLKNGEIENGEMDDAFAKASLHRVPPPFSSSSFSAEQQIFLSKGNVKGMFCWHNSCCLQVLAQPS